MSAIVTKTLTYCYAYQKLKGRNIQYYRMYLTLKSNENKQLPMASSVDKMTTETRPNMLC